MKYDCILRHGSHRETWTGELILLGMGDGWYEAEINGRGTYFHILAGRHRYGNYLCIPNHDIGCELSDFSDIFWNEERIGSLMRKVDAVTVATGPVHLPAMASGRLKNQMLRMAVGPMMGSMAFYLSGGKSMLTTVRRICGKIMHPQTALHSQWDKGWKNNSQFASLSIRRPTFWTS